MKKESLLALFFCSANTVSSQKKTKSLIYIFIFSKKRYKEYILLSLSIIESIIIYNTVCQFLGKHRVSIFRKVKNIDLFAFDFVPYFRFTEDAKNTI